MNPRGVRVTIVATGIQGSSCHITFVASATIGLHGRVHHSTDGILYFLQPMAEPGDCHYSSCLINIAKNGLILLTKPRALLTRTSGNLSTIYTLSPLDVVVLREAIKTTLFLSPHLGREETLEA